LGRGGPPAVALEGGGGGRMRKKEGYFGLFSGYKSVLKNNNTLYTFFFICVLIISLCVNIFVHISML